jgi:hypothetical protein
VVDDPCHAQAIGGDKPQRDRTWRFRQPIVNVLFQSMGS